MKKIANIIICVLLAMACSKSEPPPTPSPIEFSGSYQKVGIAATGKIRLFSNAGEIMDQSLLARFEARDSLYLYFTPRFFLTSLHIYMDTLRFESPAIVYTNFIRPIDKYHVSTLGSSLLMTSVDTLILYNNLEPMSKSPVYFMPRERMNIIEEALVSSTPGAYTYSYRFLDKFIVNGKPGDAGLTVPIFFFIDHRAVGDSITSLAHGVLDPAFPGHLANGDTVSLAEYNILYKK